MVWQSSGNESPGSFRLINAVMFCSQVELSKAAQNRTEKEISPQGLKPDSLLIHCGTTKVVP
jgi:hypothetical protein